MMASMKVNRKRDIVGMVAGTCESVFPNVALKPQIMNGGISRYAPCSIWILRVFPMSVSTDAVIASRDSASLVWFTGSFSMNIPLSIAISTYELTAGDIAASLPISSALK